MKYEFVGEKGNLTLEQEIEIIDNVNEMDGDKFLGFYPLENNSNNIKVLMDYYGVQWVLDAISNGGKYNIQDDYIVCYEDDYCISSYSKSELKFEIEDFFLDDYIDRTCEILNNGDDINFDYELFQDVDENFKSHIYNALADVCFEYRNIYNREEMGKNLDEAIEWFRTHFEDGEF